MTCVFHVEYTGPEFRMNPYSVCGRPAKFVTAEGKPVCGMHRHHYDRMNKRIGKELCRPIPVEPTEHGGTP